MADHGKFKLVIVDITVADFDRRWGDYIYSFEPPSGTGYEYYLSTLTGYKP